MNYYPNLKLEDHLGVKANYHTHTVRCGHAFGTEKEYVEAAIKAGFKVLGFSDHAPLLTQASNIQSIRMSMDMYEDYCFSVLRLKDKYEDKIRIYCGLEIEYIPGVFEDTMECLSELPPDYLILGQHYLEDREGSPYAGKPTNDIERLKLYTARVIEGIETGLFLYAAHPDIINYTGPAEDKNECMRRIARALKKHNMPAEINGGGLRSASAYPGKDFVRICKEEGCSFIIGVDCHEPSELSDDASYKACERLVKSVSGTLINNR